MNTQTFRRAYKFVSVAVSTLAIGYVLLLNFPQPLFAYSVRKESFQVYSRQPIGPELDAVLDSAESRLKTSPIYDASVARNIYLTDSHAMYALLSHKAYRSFANSVPLIDNIIINKNDPKTDLVFVNRDYNNSRSLSGVIAHETVHLFIRHRYGTLAATLMPAWKNEGYCEYIAGDSTIPLAEGILRWQQSPTNDTTYRYVKYHLMVKHLLENEHLSVDDLFKNSLDEKEVEARTFANL